jgi:hypothetical protein
MIGPVAGADVEIHGTSGLLGTATTLDDGRFGPISYPASYSGPLRVIVTGNSSSTWVCNAEFSCPNDGAHAGFGQRLSFDGKLEAVLASANANDFVSVGLLSSFVSERAQRLGEFTTANVQIASTEIADTIRSVIRFALIDLSLTFPDEFSSIVLHDLQSFSAPTGVNDALSVVLSFLNNGLMRHADPNQTTGEYIDSLVTRVAMNPVLAVSTELLTGPSQESFTIAYGELISWVKLDADGDTAAAIESLLSPATLEELETSAFAIWQGLPQLYLYGDESSPYNISISDQDLQGESTYVFQLGSSTMGDFDLEPGDYDTKLIWHRGGEWLNVTKVSNPIFLRLQYVQLDLDLSKIAMLSNGSYFSGYEVYSPNGEHRRSRYRLNISVDISGRVVDAGSDISVDERSTVVLTGTTDSPAEVSSITWSQIPYSYSKAVQIFNDDSLLPTIDIPEVAFGQSTGLRLDVVFTTGETRSDFVYIRIRNFPNIADVAFNDPVLQQCIDDAASSNSLVDSGELTDLVCAGVSDVAELEVFNNLVTVNFSGNTLVSLQPIIVLEDLEYLDISGNPTLLCSEVDELAQRLERGISLIVDDNCLSGATVN